jgi:hypothetical protein
MCTGLEITSQTVYDFADTSEGGSSSSWLSSDANSGSWGAGSSYFYGSTSGSAGSSYFYGSTSGSDLYYYYGHDSDGSWSDYPFASGANRRGIYCVVMDWDSENGSLVCTVLRFFKLCCGAVTVELMPVGASFLLCWLLSVFGRCACATGPLRSRAQPVRHTTVTDLVCTVRTWGITQVVVFQGISYFWSQSQLASADIVRWDICPNGEVTAVRAVPAELATTRSRSSVLIACNSSVAWNQPRVMEVAVAAGGATFVRHVAELKRITDLCVGDVNSDGAGPEAVVAGALGTLSIVSFAGTEWLAVTDVSTGGSTAAALVQLQDLNSDGWYAQSCEALQSLKWDGGWVP